MEWDTLFQALPKIICFCIRCQESLKEVQILWVVDVTCWCPRCFNTNFQFQIARGLLIHKDKGYIPSIPEKSIHILMSKTKIISSTATQMDTLPSMVIFKEGTYYPVYANIYKFPNGNLTSAMLLTNGRFVAIGVVVVPRHDEELLTQHSSSNAMAQTPGVLEMSGLTPSLYKNVLKDSEMQPHLEDSLCLSGTVELVNPTRITVAQGLAASENGDILYPSVEDNKAI